MTDDYFPSQLLDTIFTVRTFSDASSLALPAAGSPAGGAAALELFGARLPVTSTVWPMCSDSFSPAGAPTSLSEVTDGDGVAAVPDVPVAVEPAALSDHFTFESTNEFGSSPARRQPVAVTVFIVSWPDDEAGGWLGV